MSHRPKARHQAFTLVELLVVIGIIALLVSILVPTAMYVKEQGHKAKSTANLNNIRSAIEAYYGTFQAYPGPLSDATVVGAPGGAARPAGVNGAQITGTENLVLGLLGGLKPNGNSFAYDSTLVGTGPSSFIQSNTVLVNKGYTPFIDAAGGVLSPNDGKRCPFPGNNGADPSAYFNDTNIPDFIDGYPEALPVLYLRARPGASGIAQDSGALTAQYDLRQVMPYTTSIYIKNTPKDPRGLLALRSPAEPGQNVDGYVQISSFSGPFNGVTFIADPQTGVGNNTPTSPRAKDTFILIAAGGDRAYGTPDDITTFGAVQP
jgi:prepilin-type N-terminal cleavage/methylation domain-containing protein